MGEAFKKGDRIRRARVRSGQFGAYERMTLGSEWIVDRVRNSDDGWVESFPYMVEWRYFELVSPAPLDPSKETADSSAAERPRIDPGAVKAGDTVTVRVAPTRGLDGPRPSYAITGPTFQPSHSEGLWVGMVALGSTLVTLTDHQPAPEPEPEPEWKPGMVAKATVRGVADVQVMRLHPDPEPTEDDPSWVSVDLVDRKGKPLNGWDGKFVHNAVDVTDVRPLVVLDPESDTDRLSNIIRKVDGNHDLGAGALAEAILAEVSR